MTIAKERSPGPRQRTRIASPSQNSLSLSEMRNRAFIVSAWTRQPLRGTYCPRSPACCWHWQNERHRREIHETGRRRRGSDSQQVVKERTQPLHCRIPEFGCLFPDVQERDTTGSKLL